MIPYKYAFLFGDIIFVLPILLLAIFRKDLRHKILVLGIFGATFGSLTQLWSVQDYWRPQTITNTVIGIEDLIFGFGAFAIWGIIYELAFGKHFARRHTRTHHWILLIMPVLYVLFYLFGQIFPQYYINSLYSTCLALVITAIFILIFRKDLIFDALSSGVIGAFGFLIAYLIYLYFFPEIFNRWWLLGNLSGVSILKIPIEELLWAFSLGLMMGPMYEFYAGLKFQSELKKKKKK
jgi:hypothetical protein